VMVVLVMFVAVVLVIIFIGCIINVVRRSVASRNNFIVVLYLE
jgi:hypothetical protein